MSENQNARGGATISANDLRRLAETADGLRNRDVALVTRAGQVTVIDASDMLATDTHLLTLRTNDHTNQAKRPEFDMTLQLAHGPSLSLRVNFDAFFWSESAIEKFVFPYYARIWSPEMLTTFRERFGEDNAAMGIIHPPGSSCCVLLYTVAHGLQVLTAEEYLKSKQQS